MENKTFRALQTRADDTGEYQSAVIQKSTTDLPQGEVLIRVHYSSLNYKDALSAKGNKGVTRQYPHTPGVDAAGVVEESSVSEWQPGDEVIVTGFDLGMNTSGGFAEYISVPAKWVIKLPEGLTLKQAMIYGTAGFTAGLSVAALLHNNITPQNGPVAVSGATGGVGSVAVAILAKLGYHVIAISSKESAHNFLKTIGAGEVIPRAEVEDTSGKALLKPRFAAAIDTVGGNVLATLIKSLNYGGVATTCGMVNGGDVHTTVYPFILKGIQLVGIDSVELPLAKRLPVWQKLANEWKPDVLDSLVQEIDLEQLPQYIEQIFKGQMQGRVVVKLI